MVGFSVSLQRKESLKKQPRNTCESHILEMKDLRGGIFMTGKNLGIIGAGV